MNDKSSPHPSMKEIFLTARDKPAGEQRDAYLREIVRDNESLRIRVEKMLLKIDSDAPNRVDQALATVELRSGPAPASSIDIKTRPVIGPYKLVHSLGDGGMGEVFIAEQRDPIRRTVALKLIKRGMDSDEVLARFEAERQALAMMDHPNIAKVLDAGQADDGRPYFVMDLVRGIPITEYCDQHKLDTRTRLKLLVEVCQAVQHAHQKGIIHRDLKPGNILVELHDVRHVPKVIDFGVAKAINQRLTERTLITHFTQMVGTPLYMSPEQAELSGQDVDTRSDVYALGVLMYELLTGTTPFDKEILRSVGFDEMRRMIREDDPPRPSYRISTLNDAQRSTLSERQQVEIPKLKRHIERELDWIVLKALEKDRTRRYESASSLAVDIQRYLDGEAVHACPSSLAYRLSKSVHRNKGVLTGAAFAAGVLLLATIISAGQALKATRQSALAVRQKLAAQESENEALNQRNVARSNQYYAEIVLGQSEWKRGELSRLHGKLISHLPHPGRKDRRGWEWYYLMSLCHSDRQTMHTIYRTPDVTWSPDGRWLASANSIWRPNTGENVRRFWSSNIRQKPGSWSPDSQMYAWGTASDDSCIYVWSRTTDHVTEVRGHEGSVWCVAWSPDGRRLASGSMDHTVRIWNVASWSETNSISTGHNVTDVAWSPGGKLLAIAVTNKGLKVWKPEADEFVWESSAVMANRVSWAPDGSKLAASTDDGWCVLSSDDWSFVRQLDTATKPYSGDIAWRPDGEEIAVAGGAVVALWKPDGTAPWRVLRGHLQSVTGLAWSPDGHALATSDSSGDIKVWELETTPQPPVIAAGTSIRELAWLDDSTTIRATSSSDGRSARWSYLDGRQRSVDAPAYDGLVSWSPDRRYVAQIIEKETGPEIHIYDPKTRVIRSVWRGKHDDRIRLIVWSRDGAKLAIRKFSSGKDAVELWEVDTERQISQWSYNHSPDPHSKVTERHSSTIGQLRWSHDGALIAVGSKGGPGDDGSVRSQGHVYVIDVASARVTLKHNLRGRQDGGKITSLAWSPDNRRLVAGNTTGLVEVIDIDQGKASLTSYLHNSTIRSLDWSPDGHRIVSGAADGSVKVSTADDGYDLLSFTLDGPLTDVLWSPNGRVLAAATEIGNIHLLDGSRGYEFSETGRRRSELAWAYYLSEGKRQRDDRRREFLRLAPDSLEFWEARGHVWANLGNFERAAEEFGKETRSGVRRAFVAAKNNGFALLGAGQRDAFARRRQSILDECLDTGPPSLGGEIAWLCLLTEGTDVDSKDLVRLAQTDVNKNPEERRNVLILGAALFRDARNQAAADLLADNLKQWRHSSDSREQFNYAATLYFLAMARHELGHAFQAGRYLDEATEAFGQSSSSLTWDRRVQLKVLEVEAAASIGDRHD